MIVRLTFRCWSCLREYEMTREIDGKPTILVACPYCEKEAVAVLNPYRDKTTLLYNSPDAPATPEVATYTFPAVIPTQPADDAQSPNGERE
jgi:hypothetical protein